MISSILYGMHEYQFLCIFLSKQVFGWMELKFGSCFRVWIPWATIDTQCKGPTCWMWALLTSVVQGISMRGVPRSLLKSVSNINSNGYKSCWSSAYLITVSCRGHWQLVVLCPATNVVAWFCLLRKKPDTNIKTAINK